MSSRSGRDELILAMDRAVQETLGYFDGPGKTKSARIDRWGAWDVLTHFLYWHDATGWGIESAGMGGPPWPVPGTADEVNDAALALHGGESFDAIVRQLRESHARLLRAARGAEDLERPAFRLNTGRLVTISERLETLGRHWRSHLQALKEA